MFSAANLVRMRKALGLSQEELARQSSLATVTVSKLEEGRNTDPKMSTVRKLANALDCPIDAFFADEPAEIRNGGWV